MKGKKLDLDDANLRIEGRRIIQLMPAPAGLVAVFDDGDKENRQPIVAFALYNNGQTGSMVLDGGSGMLDDVAEMSNLSDTEYNGR